MRVRCSRLRRYRRRSGGADCRSGGDDDGAHRPKRRLSSLRRVRRRCPSGDGRTELRETRCEAAWPTVRHGSGHGRGSGDDCCSGGARSSFCSYCCFSLSCSLMSPHSLGSIGARTDDSGLLAKGLRESTACQCANSIRPLPCCFLETKETNGIVVDG